MTQYNNIDTKTIILIQEGFSLGFSAVDIARGLNLSPKVVKAYAPENKVTLTGVFEFFLLQFLNTPDFDTALKNWDVSDEMKQILLESKAISHIKKDLSEAKLFHKWQKGCSQQELAVMEGFSQSYISRKIQRFSSIYKDEFMKNKTRAIILEDIKALRPIPPVATAYALLAEQYKLTMTDIKKLLQTRNINLLETLQSLRHLDEATNKLSTRAEVIELYSQGLTQKEIGERLSIHQTKVSRILSDQLGVQKKHIINTPEEQEIVIQLQQGIDDDIILETYNISECTLRNIKIKNNLFYNKYNNYTDQVDTIIALSNTGKKPKEIAQQLDIPIHAVYQIRYKINKDKQLHDVSRVRTTSVEKQKVMLYYQSGKTYKEIMNLTGLKYSTINGIIQRGKLYNS